jgi:hypothetical protein
MKSDPIAQDGRNCLHPVIAGDILNMSDRFFCAPYLKYMQRTGAFFMLFASLFAGLPA